MTHAPTDPTTTSWPDAAGAEHTVREIAQQPALWQQVLDLVRARDGEVRAFLDPLMARADLRIVLTGAGTSAFAGAVLCPGLSRRLGRRVDAVATTDIVSSPMECFAGDAPTLLVSLARSGDSPESLAAVELAQECLSEVHHLAITCNPRGALARFAGDTERGLLLVMPDGADDRGFAMTSSATTMLLTAGLVLGGIDLPVVADVVQAGQDILAQGTVPADGLLEAGARRVVYLGSGALTALAREAALKVVELAAGRITSTFDSPLGFRHGPKAVLDPASVVLVFLSNDPYTRRYDLDILVELAPVLPPGQVVAVFAGSDAGIPDTVVRWAVPGLGAAGDAALALPYLIYAQTLALQQSLALGLTPDNPFPSGEVNRVVQGVVVHPLTSA